MKIVIVLPHIRQLLNANLRFVEVLKNIFSLKLSVVLERIDYEEEGEIHTVFYGLPTAK